MKKFLKDFKEFAFRGNVLDMAVGVMIASAFGKIVSSMVNDLLMPLISLLFNGSGFENMFIVLGSDGGVYATAAEAQAAGFATFNYGTFISVVVDFVVIALCVFLLVKLLSARKKPEPAPAPQRICPFCKMPIDSEATRCPHCTSSLNEK